jgi:hypothetical protein
VKKDSAVSGGLILLFSLCAASCGGSSLPEGWEDAEEIAVVATDCDEGEELESSFEVTENGDPVAASYLRAMYRCSQEVCAYHLEEDGIAKVLTQPCEMDPERAAKCDCRYDLSFEFPRPSSGAVEIWHGTDNYGSPAEQSLVFEEQLPVAR